MACDLKILNGYGDGSLGDVTNPAGQINSYANITAYTANSITIGTPSNGIYEKFAVGKEIAIHVSAGNGTSTDTTYLGAKLHCKITAVNGSVLTVDKDFTAVLPLTSFANYQVQAITVAQFKSLTLSSGSITPPAYSITNKYGGIILIKCSNALTMSGGSISLTDKGIPVSNTAYRPLTAQETEMSTTGATYAWENHITARQFLLNSGDGAIMLLAKAVVNTAGATTRIGGTTAGVTNYPYTFTAPSPALTRPAPVLGGSTILIATDTFTGFLPDIISKGKGSGAGYGRCYIATETSIPADERLYAQDCISNPTRLRNMGIANYGSGLLGNVNNVSSCVNSYASVLAIDGKNITVNNITNGLYDSFIAGIEVVFHISAKKTTGDSSLLGKFFVTKIISVVGSTLVLAAEIPYSVSLTDYYCQLVTIPQCTNFALSTPYDKTLAWNDTKKIGGIFVIKATDTVDLTNGGQIILTGKGIPIGTQRPLIANQCSGQQKDYLPINQIGGSALIIAKNLKCDAASRLGSTTSGSLYGGAYGTTVAGSGANGNDGSAGGAGYGGGGGSSNVVGGVGAVCCGGVGATATSYSFDPVASTGLGFGMSCVHSSVARAINAAGCNLFIVADTITSFNISNMSTGGGGGVGCTNGLSYFGDGGSGPGTCFLYANKVTSADYTGVVI